MTLFERRFAALADALIFGDYGVTQVSYLSPRGASIYHHAGATAGQRAAAAALIANWPWTQSAQDETDLQQAREEGRQRGTRVDGVSVASRASFLVLLDAVNELRAREGLAAITKAQAETARKAKIDAGLADN